MLLVGKELIIVTDDTKCIVSMINKLRRGQYLLRKYKQVVFELLIFCQNSLLTVPEIIRIYSYIEGFFIQRVHFS